MGFWTRWDPSRERSLAPIAIDRKIIRFRRLVEQHSEVLEIFRDLEEKQSGEYILDRRYMEARIDRVYEGARRILYDMHVISDSHSDEGYEALDRLRAVSEKILKEAFAASGRQGLASRGETADWETLALQALFQDMTRAPVYGTGADSGTPTGAVAPESLTEWVGWGHLGAAQWLADSLPDGPPPVATLMDEETGLWTLRVFALGGVKGAEAVIRDSLARQPSGRPDTTSLLPLRVFLEGLTRSPDEAGGRRLRLEDTGRQKADKRTVRLDLYAGDDFLLLRLPAVSSLRLFWCSVGMEPAEQRLYLYGTSPPCRPRGVQKPFLAAQHPYPVYRCRIADKWMYWASHLSWAQGEERVRVLGHSLAAGMTLRGDPAGGEPVGTGFQESIAAFLKQTTMLQREVPEW